MPFDIRDVVRVTSTIQASVEPTVDLGRTLFLTVDSSVLNAGGAGKIRTYTRFSEVADDFGATTEPYIAAQRYFAQDPFPRNLLIGRWASAEVFSQILGGAPGTLATLQAISTGSFVFGGEAATTVDLSSASSLADVATVIQAALRATPFDLAAATVTYNSSPSRFVVSTGEHVTTYGLFSAHTTGADLAGPLGLDTASGARYLQGSAAETVSEAYDNLDQIDSSWHQIVIEDQYNGTQTMIDTISWTEASNRKIFFAESNETAALTVAETASFAARATALEPERTIGTWDDQIDYKAASVAARYSSIDFRVPGSLITGKFKKLPGTASTNLTTTQKQELTRKRWNYYETIYAEGTALAPGVWGDVIIWLDWIQSEIETTVYNHIFSANRIPYTPAGVGGIKEVIEAACQGGVRNGGIAPGTVSPTMAADIRQATEDADFDGVLTNGYLVFVPPVAEQTQTQRASRSSPPFRVWLKGSNAVHFVTVDLRFED